MEGIDEFKNFISNLTGMEINDLPEFQILFSLKSYAKSEFFIKQNARPVYSGLVLSGALREFYIDKDGREYNKAFCFKGDFTGSYYDLSLGSPSNVAIQALTECKILIAPHIELKKLINSDVLWLKAAYTIAHNLLMKKLEKEYQLLTLSAKERYVLLQQQHPELEQLIPGHHIASYLGITPISLSRIRAQIKNQFLIK